MYGVSVGTGFGVPRGVASSITSGAPQLVRRGISAVLVAPARRKRMNSRRDDLSILILSHDFDLIAFYHLPYDPVLLASLGEKFL